MDKTLEIVMVAVALIVAAVIVVALLQGQTSNLGSFADDQTNSSGCGIAKQQYCSALDGNSVTARAANIHNNNPGCDWYTGSDISSGNTNSVSC